MTILSGFLYIKHGRVGTRSEGPDYYLQMADGEVFLQYEERMLWDPDYHLEYFGRRMVQIEGELLEEQKFQVKEIKEICEATIPQIYAEYRARIVNASSSELTAIHLGMIGDGGLTVDSLQAGASTEELTFKLRKRNPGVPYPFSYGDYAGFYSQLGMQKNIFIVGPQTMTTITIDDKSYQVE